jgi:hypothetical protein
MICMKKMPSRGSYGAADRTRTYYPIITNDVLYLMSYSGHGAVFSTATSIRKVLFYVIGTRHNCTIILDDLCFHDLNVQGVRRGFNLPNDQR